MYFLNRNGYQSRCWNGGYSQGFSLELQHVNGLYDLHHFMIDNQHLFPMQLQSMENKKSAGMDYEHNGCKIDMYQNLYDFGFSFTFDGSTCLKYDINLLFNAHLLLNVNEYNSNCNQNADVFINSSITDSSTLNSSANRTSFGKYYKSDNGFSADVFDEQQPEMQANNNNATLLRSTSTNHYLTRSLRKNSRNVSADITSTHVKNGNQTAFENVLESNDSNYSRYLSFYLNKYCFILKMENDKFRYELRRKKQRSNCYKLTSIDFCTSMNSSNARNSHSNKQSSVVLFSDLRWDEIKWNVKGFTVHDQKIIVNKIWICKVK